VKSSRRLIALIAAVAVVAAIALNVAGVVLIPVGPMGSQQPAVRDVARSTLNHRDNAEYLTPIVEDTWPVSVTVVRVTPVGVTVPGSVQVLGSLAFDISDPAERLPDGTDGIMLGVQSDPGPGWSGPQPAAGVIVEPKGAAEHRGRAFLVRITPDPDMETAVLHFDVEYTLGPFHFITTAWGPLGTTVVMCGGERPVAGQDGCGPS
jgi:hypothetical protein